MRCNSATIVVNTYYTYFNYYVWKQQPKLVLLLKWPFRSFGITIPVVYKNAQLSQLNNNRYTSSILLLISLYYWNIWKLTSALVISFKCLISKCDQAWQTSTLKIHDWVFFIFNRLMKVVNSKLYYLCVFCFYVKLSTIPSNYSIFLVLCLAFGNLLVLSKWSTIKFKVR